MSFMSPNNAINMKTSVVGLFVFCHIDSDVDHLIMLHPEYAEAAENLDTNKLWIILQQSDNQHGTFNASEIKIE